MTGGLLLFAVPANVRKGVFLMDWKSTKALPWDVLILFGGGLSLANAIQSHGVATYLGGFASGASGLPVFVLIAAVSLGILFLTELTSNTATAATFLPIVGALAVSMGHNPLLLLIPTALAANCSYMMPVGTPPNAIVFGSGRVGLPQMATAGLILNFALVPVFLFFLWLLGGPVFGIVPGTLPSWAH
jgi:sodium-dependent dicarboxylate transporter 2/3/5